MLINTPVGTSCKCSHIPHIGICEFIIERNHVEDICGCPNSIMPVTDVRELRRRDAIQQRNVEELKAKQPKSRKPYAKYKKYK